MLQTLVPELAWCSDEEQAVLTHSSREFSGTLHSLLYEERPDYANAIDNSHFLRLIGELDFVADQSGAVDEAGLRKHAPDIGEAKGEHGDITNNRRPANDKEGI